MRVLNITGYRFVVLQNLEEKREEWRAVLLRYGCRGTVLLAAEGINLCLAGEEAAMLRLMQWCRAQDAWHALEMKKSWSTFIPFRYVRVKIKPEIVTMGMGAGSWLTDHPAAYVTAPRFKRWLDHQCDEDGRPLIVLDVRNRFEYDGGHFHGAHHLDIPHFSALPQKIRHSPLAKDQTIVAYCTGGIRCEKACAYLLAEGWPAVYQLQGGILQYFATCPGAQHYQGNCFVFDDRRALNASLQPITH